MPLSNLKIEGFVKSQTKSASLKILGIFFHFCLFYFNVRRSGGLLGTTLYSLFFLEIGSFGRYRLQRVWIDSREREREMWLFSRKGPSGFSACSTAEEVTQGIDGTGLTGIVTGGFVLLLSILFLFICFLSFYSFFPSMCLCVFGLIKMLLDMGRWMGLK